VADHHGALGAERIENTHHIRHQLVLPVGVHRLGRVAEAVAAQIRRQHMEALGGQKRHLIAPGIAALREAVQQDHIALLGGLEIGQHAVEIDATGFIIKIAVRHSRHAEVFQDRQVVWPGRI